MPENLMNESHKAVNDAYRRGYDGIRWDGDEPAMEAAMSGQSLLVAIREMENARERADGKRVNLVPNICFDQLFAEAILNHAFDSSYLKNEYNKGD